MKLPRVHICLGVKREGGECIALYAGEHGGEAEKAFATASGNPELGGALLFKFPQPNKRKTFPVPAAVEKTPAPKKPAAAPKAKPVKSTPPIGADNPDAHDQL